MVKGVILTGGRGSRLAPTTEIYNKHVVHVYDRPMIHYPIQTLAQMGCEDVVIVGSPQGVGDIAETVKDGNQFGVEVEYRVQNEPNGVAGALKKAERSVSGMFMLILGDIYLDPAPKIQSKPTLFWNSYDYADQHSVWNPETDAIIEKPRYVSLGNRAIIAYQYDDRVFDFINGMTPAQSGELEIVDIHNYYRLLGAQFVEYAGYFSDMGTPNGLLRAAQHEQRKQNAR